MHAVVAHPAEPDRRHLAEVVVIEWIASPGFGFVDLTLEPPRAASWLVDPVQIRRALERHGLAVVGHTAYYLPLASGIEEIAAPSWSSSIAAWMCSPPSARAT